MQVKGVSAFNGLVREESIQGFVPGRSPPVLGLFCALWPWERPQRSKTSVLILDTSLVSSKWLIPFFFFLKILFIFRQRGREGEREGEKHYCVVASCAPPTGDLARNPGMCPDWELNQ